MAKLVFVVIILTLLITPFVKSASGQNMTGKKPDIVYICQEDNGTDIRPECSFGCDDYYPVKADTPPHSGPLPSPGITWTRIGYRFDRIEFYSKPMQPSENWLLILHGYTVSSPTVPNLPIPPSEYMFFTIGTGNICGYRGLSTKNGKKYSVKMISYYGQQ